MHEHTTIYLDGRWVPSTGTGSIDVVDPATEEVIGRVPAGAPADVDRAVVAARAAFESWSQTTPAERADHLKRIADGLFARQSDIAARISREMGMPYAQSSAVQFGLPALNVTAMAELAHDVAAVDRVGNSLIVREPVGVVGAITPWNYPLHQVVAKVAPALAAGCTVVLKPSEVAPLSAHVLAEVLDEVGLPPGVFNLVSGTGPVVGEAIAAHPDVDMVTFTGSTAAGRRVMAVASATVKRVALELGGKSPLVILDDADLGTAVARGVDACFLNSGQTCSALTRMVVPRARLAEVEKLARQRAEAAVVGDPFHPATTLGPLVSQAQRERVRGHITQGIEEGARLVTGGATTPGGLDRGYYVQPTIFSDVTTDMTIAQEEIFGPVLVIQPYDDEDDAVRIANSTAYGLAAGVWSASLDRAQRVARRIRAGQVEVNGGAFNVLAPFGGYKQSGNGREMGRFGIHEFLEVKAVQLP
jgi:aldehyde dehydrogenase (NAD+)